MFDDPDVLIAIVGFPSLHAAVQDEFDRTDRPWTVTRYRVRKDSPRGELDRGDLASMINRLVIEVEGVFGPIHGG